jgi:hypothetical protein
LGLSDGKIRPLGEGPDVGDDRSGAQRTPPERLRPAEQPMTRGRRRGRPVDGRPPGRLPEVGGKPAIRTTHSLQYTPSPAPPRSQRAPQPSQIFVSTRKYFIISVLQRVSSPGEPQSFSGRRGSLKLLGGVGVRAGDSLGPYGGVRHLFTLVRSSCYLGKSLRLFRPLHPLQLGGSSPQSGFPGERGNSVIAHDKQYCQHQIYI